MSRRDGGTATATSDGATVIVEAATVEEALAEVTRQLGAAAEIVEAKKVTTGGLGGFFAREAVQVMARAATAGDSATASVEAVNRLTAASDFVAPVDRLVDSVNRHEAAVVPSPPDIANVDIEAFGSVLRRELAQRGLRLPTTQERDDVLIGVAPPPVVSEIALPTVEPIVSELIDLTSVATMIPEPATPTGTPSPAPGIPQPPQAVAPTNLPEVHAVTNLATEVALTASAAPSAEVPEAPVVEAHSQTTEPQLRSTASATTWIDSTGPVSWSLDRLTRLGLPYRFVQAAVGLAPEDELGWVMALAAVAEHHCGPLPEGSSVAAGPSAQRLATAIGVPSVEFPEAPPYGGSIALKMDGAPASRAWLSRVQGDRWLNLVVDAEGFNGPLDGRPIAVSWTEAGGLVPALQLCADHELTLGYFIGPNGQGVRAAPLEVALALRDLLPRR